jgi:hypothetical protein
MIYIHPVGGLGNMLFHIASIYSLARDNNDELCLLNIDKKINELIHDGRANLDHAPAYRYLFDRFPQKNMEISNIINWCFEYNPIIYNSEFEYIGYFQSEKYFKHRKLEIIELFKPNDSFLNDINKYSSIFGNISLHVRRNDYAKLYPHIHPPQSIIYYNNALSLLPQEYKVIVFSDDIEWCKENFIGDRFVFISEIDYISLYIMSKMKYHIIANSSFSWWGAWLSDAEIVIAPKIWFGSNAYPDQDIIPESWIKI